MLLTENNPGIVPANSTDQTHDPLGLAPLPIENRQRYLRFKLARKNETLIPLSDILEVLQLPLEEMLAVPDMPGCVLGVCSWQGETLWLVDLNQMVGDRPLFEQSIPNTKPTVIVVQAQQKSLGLLVESVSDIDLFVASQIRMVAGLCPPALEPYVMGYCPNQAGIVLSVANIIHSPRLRDRE